MSKTACVKNVQILLQACYLLKGDSMTGGRAYERSQWPPKQQPSVANHRTSQAEYPKDKGSFLTLHDEQISGFAVQQGVQQAAHCWAFGIDALSTSRIRC